MKKSCLEICFAFMLCASNIIWANDGVFTASGEHLFPFKETVISVKKEVLSVKRISQGKVAVEVYYEFYNPGSEKVLEVGFESPKPSGDVSIVSKDGQNPFIHNFSVQLNNSALPYTVDLVTDSNYYRTGKLDLKKSAKLKKAADTVDDDFRFVYHFRAKFLNGINILIHKYSLDLSWGIVAAWEFNYLLTPAKRWANNQIDDFTLSIDLGNYQEYYLYDSFSNELSDWTFTGLGSLKKLSPSLTELDLKYYDQDRRFTVHTGKVIYSKKNFLPDKELCLFCLMDNSSWEVFDYETCLLSLPIEADTYITSAKDQTSLKILRNLPYARRGYVFSDKQITNYYNRLDWYIPDTSYKAELKDLLPEEISWLKQLKIQGAD